MNKEINIIGAGVAGLWCGFLLSLNGAKVTIFESDNEALEKSCSYKAGGMLAPYCEGEIASEEITILGTKSLELWQKYFPEFITQNGSLLVAHPKDYNQLEHFSKVTIGHEWWNKQQISDAENDIAQFFSKGLFYKNEGHLEPRKLLRELISKCKEQGVVFHFETPAPKKLGGIIIDTRGMGAKKELDSLRGVKGEMIVIKSTDVVLTRPIRLLHHKYPLYIVPRANSIYMIGATTIETESNTGMSLRSAGELLTQAYHLHPAFAEAEILEMNAGLRPAFDDNEPKIIEIPSENKFILNGLYRHGWLISPMMASRLVDKLDLLQMS